MRSSSVPAPGGGEFEVLSVGEGPGIVVVHGSGVSRDLYRRLAVRLSDRFTVHLYNRRGRPHAPPYRGGYTLDGDIEDLVAVLEGTGSRNAFGHSGGGLVALRAALAHPCGRIAVYNPGISVDGLVSMAFLDRFEAAVNAGDATRAMAIVNRSVRTGGPGSGLPEGLQAFLARPFLHTPIGRGIAGLLPTAVPELRAIAEHDGPATGYSGVRAEVLLATGSRSPREFAATCMALAAAIPRARYLSVPFAAHNAPCVGRERFARPFAEFFASAPVAAPGR